MEYKALDIRPYLTLTSVIFHLRPLLSLLGITLMPLLLFKASPSLICFSSLLVISAAFSIIFVYNSFISATSFSIFTMVALVSSLKVSSSV